MTSTLAISSPLRAIARRYYGALVGGGHPGLTRPREAVELMADGHLAVRQPRRVLLQQLALRPHQLSGVVVLHLLLQRAGRRCRKGHAAVDRMWRQVRHTAALLGSRRGSCKRRECQRQGWKQQASHRMPPKAANLNQPRVGLLNLSLAVVELRCRGKALIS